MSEENENLLRTKDSYDRDAGLKDPQHTGIRGPTVFNKILGFNIIDNAVLDLMHDILEGIAEYVINNLLDYYILEKGLFTLNYLNLGVKKYKQIGKNKPADIKIDLLTNKIKIKMSASEIKDVVLFLGFIIGDIAASDVSNCEEDHWSSYIVTC